MGSPSIGHVDASPLSALSVEDPFRSVDYTWPRSIP